MSSIEKPYIGITGISQPLEAETISEVFSQVLPESSSHQGMSGYLVSFNTLKGGRERFSKYPDISTLSALLRETCAAGLNAIHYRSSDRSSLSLQIAKLFEQGNIYADSLCHALQLNIAWPEVEQVEQMKVAMPNLRLILTLTPKIIRNESRFEIEDRLADYKNLVDFVLIDPSGGIGEAFESNAVLPLYTSVKDIMKDQIVVLGGGFNERNVRPRLAEISGLLRTKQFGIDAEGGLREVEGGNPHAGRLSVDRTLEYIRNAASFFNS